MVKTYSPVLNCFSSTSLAIALSVSSCEIKRVVLLGMMGTLQISPCGFVCEREES